MTTLFRVVNQGLVKNSLLIDKVDRSQGNSEGYARKAKQKVYVPLLNPLDSSVHGYIDMVPTDDVLLSMSGKGTIAQLKAKGYVSVTAFASTLTATPVVTAASHSAAANIGGQTGSAATISAVSGGKATFTGLTGMTTNSVGRDLVITGSATSANNGTFRITDFVSATSVKVSNSAAVSPDANNGSITWTERSESRTVVTGTTMASLAPDVTYVTLTNLSGVSQTLTDQQLLAAVPPTAFSTTSVVIQDALVTIGTPTTGWKVKVQANSKSSNLFTLT